MNDATKYDPRYLKGIEFFNECEYFEAHEIWEDLWTEYQGPLRKFYQGLIQVAVCLHHFVLGNIRGARKLYHSSRGYLEPHCPHAEGIDLNALLQQLQACCAEFIDLDAEPREVTIDVELLPEIHLDSTL